MSQNHINPIFFTTESPSITYKCDRSGPYVNKSSAQVDLLGKTRKTDCPFKMTGNYYKRVGLWQIKIKNPNHNHSPSEDPACHSIYRRLDLDQKSLVTQLTEAGVKPLQIKNTLVQSSHIPSESTLNTIYNHRNQMRSDSLKGSTPMEALFSEIRKFSFFH